MRTLHLPEPLSAADDCHVLLRQQYLPLPPEQLFDFFADAGNLERITPPWMGFRILPPLPDGMGEGTRIDYRIRLGPVPMRWTTRIRRWNPPHYFVDDQERGPYVRWEHLHFLEPSGEGTVMTDRVLYRLPFGPLGHLVHRAWVRQTVSAIFDYRFDAVAEIFEPQVRSAAHP